MRDEPAFPGQGLFLRALFAFLALPGMVAFVIPLVALRPQDTRFHPAALPIVVLGTGLLLRCVRDFYVAGRGTLAPWTPPKQLVVVGLYRLSRNPMYVAVLVILCGWAFGFRARPLWMYAAVMAVMFHLRVVLAEERWLARTHGDAWTRYRAEVPRWLFHFNRSDRSRQGG